MDGVNLRALKIGSRTRKILRLSPQHRRGAVARLQGGQGGADEAPRRARHARHLQFLAEASQEDSLSRKDTWRLVAWFTDPEQCPEFKALSEVTQDEYKDRLASRKRPMTISSAIFPPPTSMRRAIAPTTRSGWLGMENRFHRDRRSRSFPIV